MSNVQYDGDVSFNFRQVHFEGSFSHWEGELVVKGEVMCEATGPNIWAVHDELTDYVFEQTVKVDNPVLDHNWFKEDSNAKA